MRSWSLDVFVQDFGVDQVKKVWKISRQGIEAAIAQGRDITVTKYGNRNEGYWEITESKLLDTTEAKDV